MATIASRPSPVLHERGPPGYRRVGAALWCAGLATFVLIYCVQGLLPSLAAEFGVSSSTSSLVLSATTGTPDALPAVLAGLLLGTVGFFGAHSLASGWVGRRSSSCPAASRPWRRRSTCWPTTRGAASADRSAAWRTTVQAGSASSATSAPCCSGLACSRWHCGGSRRPDEDFLPGPVVCGRR